MNKKGYYGFEDILNTALLFMVLTILAFQLFNSQLFPSQYETSQYQTVKSFVDLCENEHKELIETQIKFNELNNLDMTRAYKECREDLNYERRSNEGDNYSIYFWGVITFMWGMIIRDWYGIYKKRKNKTKTKSLKKKKKK